MLLEFDLQLEERLIQLRVRIREGIVSLRWNVSAKQRRFRKAVRAEIHCSIVVQLKSEVDKKTTIVTARGLANAAKARRSIRIEVDGKSALDGEFGGHNVHSSSSSGAASTAEECDKIGSGYPVGDSTTAMPVSNDESVFGFS